MLPPPLSRCHSAMRSAFICVLLPLSATVNAADATAPSASVARILGSPLFDVTVESRLAAVKRLSSRLSPGDKAALLRFAGGDQPEDMQLAVWHSFINDIFDLLLQQDVLPAGLDDQLLRMARENSDPVLRDYSLQKLDRLTVEPHPEKVRSAALTALQESAALHGQHFQGTALLTWRRTLKDTGDPAFRKAVMACLKSPDSTGPARMAALQAGASCGIKECAAEARKVLGDPEATLPHKLSALSALGTVGETADSALITPFLPDPALAPAAAATLKKLGS